MILQIVATTDGKFLGMTFDDEQPIILNHFNGFEFKPTEIKNIGDGLIQLSNSNYVVVTKQQ